MIFLVLLILEIVSLYFLSRRVIRGIYRFFYRVSRRKNFGMYLFAILFLPGTFIHEISHFLAALFLLVPVGELELIPKFKEEGGGVDLGSVAIAKTDPVRRFLIGIAPVVFGLFIIFFLPYLVTTIRITVTVWEKIFVGFIIFEVSNSMFASKKDLEGAAILLIFILFVIAFLYVLGIRIPVSLTDLSFNQSTLEILQNANIFLLVPIVIDAVVLLALKRI